MFQEPGSQASFGLDVPRKQSKLDAIHRHEPVLAVSAFAVILPSVVTPAARPLLQSIKEHALLLFGLLAVMWVVEVLDFLLPVVDLDQFGIRPRTGRGLLGVMLSPFLHAGFGHLISNSLPFLLLGGLVMTGGRRQFLLLSSWVTVMGGAGVWLLGGSRTVHLGASLLIFGYLGFLLTRGIVERSVGGILLSLALLFGYGGMLYGVLPGQPGISWLGHLCGFLAGTAGAWLLAGRAKNSKAC